jgi:hypothetical protein
MVSGNYEGLNLPGYLSVTAVKGDCESPEAPSVWKFTMRGDRAISMSKRADQAHPNAGCNVKR